MAVVHWVQCPWVHLALLGQLAGQVTGLKLPWALERGGPLGLVPLLPSPCPLAHCYQAGLAEELRQAGGQLVAVV